MLVIKNSALDQKLENIITSIKIEAEAELSRTAVAAEVAVEAGKIRPEATQKVI